MLEQKKQQKLGKPDVPRPDRVDNFVMTEKSIHQAWGAFTVKKPKAAALLHFMVARMDRSTNAVVASHGVLAGIMNCTTRSIKTYLDQLESDKWIQVISLGKGQTNAYVINSMVAWSKNRQTLKYAQFTAQVIADRADQSEKTLSHEGLRVIPVLMSDEYQVAHGDDGEPPSQPHLDGIEHNLPSRDCDFDLTQEQDVE